MHVRALAAGEEPILFELFQNTIRNVNVRDYRESQLTAWALLQMSGERLLYHATRHAGCQTQGP